MAEYREIRGENVQAALAQLGERQTEDLKAPCSIHGGGIFFVFILLQFTRNYRLKSTKSGFSLDG